MNSVNLIGRLTRDPDLRYTPAGMAICDFGVAVNDRRKVNDQWEDVANFFDITAFGKTAEMVGNHFHKGKEIGISGRLKFDQWVSKEGQKRSKVGVIADRITFVGPKTEPAAQPQQEAHYTPAADETVPF